MLGGFDEFVLHFVGDFWDFSVTLLVDQPAEQIILFHKIALINVRNTTFIEHLSGVCAKANAFRGRSLTFLTRYPGTPETVPNKKRNTHNSWNIVNAPFVSFLFIVDFDKGNVILIAFIIDIFQFG